MYLLAQEAFEFGSSGVQPGFYGALRHFENVCDFADGKALYVKERNGQPVQILQLQNRLPDIPGFFVAGGDAFGISSVRTVRALRRPMS
jgi:hypothetical protein